MSLISVRCQIVLQCTCCGDLRVQRSTAYEVESGHSNVKELVKGTVLCCYTCSREDSAPVHCCREDNALEHM